MTTFSIILPSQRCTRPTLRDHFTHDPHNRKGRFHVDLDGFIEMSLELKQDIAAEYELLGVHLERPFDCQAVVKEVRHQQFAPSFEGATDLESSETSIDEHSV